MPDQILFRTHVKYVLAIKTPLARQLYGVALGMANSLSHLVFSARQRLPPDRCKQVTALAFEIVYGLQSRLNNEKAALQAQQIKPVTIFPVQLNKELLFCYHGSIAIMQMLVDLDKLAQHWHGLCSLGKLSRDEFNQKHQEWRAQFRRASVQLNTLKRSWWLGKEQHYSPKRNRIAGTVPPGQQADQQSGAAVA